MCLNQHFIRNRYTNKSVWISCGKCPACIQSKAIARSNRIRYASEEAGYITLFCTFTYRDEAVPFFKFDEFCNLSNPFSDGFLNIYRNSDTYYKRHSDDILGNHRYKRFINHYDTSKILSKVYIPKSLRKNQKFKELQNSVGFGRIGVLFPMDFQNFIKRLKINLIRHYGYKSDFKYFYCGEYGPQTTRPHFHALFHIPMAKVELFRRAIAQNWSYDDFHKTYKYAVIAKNASAYVSSYVNCDASLPLLFKECRELSPKHRFSQYYGFSKKEFSLSSLLQKIRERDLRFDVARIKDKCLVSSRVLLPSYVINRYFPKFKGFSRLNSDEIFSIYEAPHKLDKYRYITHMSYEECRRIENYIRKKQISSGLSLTDYALYGSQVWVIRSSNAFVDSFNDVQNYRDNCYHYYNFKDIGFSSSLEELIENYDCLIDDDLNIFDYNKYALNVTKHISLYDAYYSYSKDRKVRNSIYCITENV